MILEIGCENLLMKIWSRVVEKGQLATWPYSVEGRKAQTDKPVETLLLGEAGGDLQGCLDSLALHFKPANGEVVRVYSATRTGPISISNTPCVAAEELGCARLGGTVNLLAPDLVAWCQATENPQIRGSSVQVEHERLWGRSDGDGGDIGNVYFVDGYGSRRARVAFYPCKSLLLFLVDMGDCLLDVIRSWDTVFEKGSVCCPGRVESFVATRIAHLLQGDPSTPLVNRIDPR